MKEQLIKEVFELLNQYSGEQFNRFNDTDTLLAESNDDFQNWTFQITDDLKIIETFNNPADFWTYEFTTVAELTERLNQIYKS